MILRYKYTVQKLRVDRLQAMTGIIYEPLFTRKTLLSNKWHVVKHGLDSLVKHGLDSISKTWTLLVKHGLY